MIDENETESDSARLARMQDYWSEPSVSGAFTGTTRDVLWLIGKVREGPDTDSEVTRLRDAIFVATDLMGDKCHCQEVGLGQCTKCEAYAILVEAWRGVADHEVSDEPFLCFQCLTPMELGTGLEGTKYLHCPTCFPPEDAERQKDDRCPSCEGSGERERRILYCKVCGGTGKDAERKEADAATPAKYACDDCGFQARNRTVANDHFHDTGHSLRPSVADGINPGGGS